MTARTARLLDTTAESPFANAGNCLSAPCRGCVVPFETLRPGSLRETGHELEGESCMRREKRIVESKILGRTAHIDVFELGTGDPRSLVVLFGGSGIDDEEYAERASSVIPIFDTVLTEIGELDLTLVYVTAPPDVPFRRFAHAPICARDWNLHLTSELLCPWHGTPFFVVGFSGGAALAFHGVHAHPDCFGGATLGADGIDERFCLPDHWRSRLQMYAARHDRVCQHPKNLAIMSDLERKGIADVIYLPAGHHRLSDYATRNCLGEILLMHS